MKYKIPQYLLLVLSFFLIVAIAGCKSDDEMELDPDQEQVEEDENEEEDNEPELEPVVEEAFAFPGAEGFGRHTTGGRGGKVIYVTNLNDSGSGSFRAAVEETGPRYILFKTSGNIELKSRINIRNGNLTIAGQTAPGDGITLKNYPVIIQADNVIIRFLRFRMGDEAQQEADALESRFNKNIIIDHCSMSWSTDECVSMYANENTTLQWCIIVESLRNSVHDKGKHGYGGIWGGKYASFHHNLLAHHDSRNPRFGERANEADALTGLVDFRNNVIYNWGNNSSYGGEAMNINIVNNYYKPGPATPGGSKRGRIIAIDKSSTAGSEVYGVWGKFFIDGNVVDGVPDATNDNWEYGVYNQFHSDNGTVTEEERIAMRHSEPHSIDDNVITHTAEEAYELILNYGGASLVRDAVDERIVKNVRDGDYSYEGSNGSTKGIIDTQGDVGGWPALVTLPPSLDSSGDGMPDDWKKSMKLDPNKNQANGRDLSTAYDNVEVYINSLVKDIMEKR